MSAHSSTPYDRTTERRNALRHIVEQLNTVTRPSGRLVLSRKPGEVIHIGGDYPLELQVVSVIGSTVRLAFQAREEVPIFRGEVVDAVMADLQREAELQTA